VNSNLLLYAATRRGYRAGSYNSPLYDPFLASVQTFRPETLDDVELGGKLRFDTGGIRGSFDAAVFRGVDKDVQLPFATSQLLGPGVGCVPEAASTTGSTAPLCTTASGQPGRQIQIANTTTYVNAGKSVLSGFEAAATLSPLEGLTLSGGVGYVKFKAKSVTNDPNLAAVFRANGRVVPDFTLREQPKWTASAGIFYQTPGEFLGGHLVLNTDLRYTAKWREADFFISPSTTVDASAGIRGIGGTRLDIRLVGTNIFNEVYNYGSAGSAAGNGYLSTINAAPRIISVQLRYNFGR
jgi:iron complex outermembrane receptor protein